VFLRWRCPKATPYHNRRGPRRGVSLPAALEATTSFFSIASVWGFLSFPEGGGTGERLRECVSESGEVEREREGLYKGADTCASCALLCRAP
jgi:hypothetical protein